MNTAELPTRRFDVVVVGARCAGAATALLLTRAGLDVLVLDRSRYGSDTISTHGLVRGGTLQLHRWGLLDRLAGTPPIRRTVFHFRGDPGPDRVDVDVNPVAGVDALYAPRRTVLDPILIDAAAQAGATVRFGTAVTDVLRDPAGAVRGVVARPHHGTPVDIPAGLVVGADGLRSVIADRVAAPVERAGTAGTGSLYGYWTGVPAEGYEWYWRPGVFAGLVPTTDGRTVVIAGGPAARVRDLGPAGYHRLLAEADPTLPHRVRAGRHDGAVRVFLAPPGYLRRAHGDGWALVGDAGSWKDPIGMHGITDAFRDAELLARAVAAAPDPAPRRTRVLAHYQATRDRLSVPLHHVIDQIAGFQWDQPRLRRLLLQLHAAMSDEVHAIVAFDSGIGTRAA